MSTEHPEIELEEIAADTFVCHTYRRDPWSTPSLAPWISVNVMVVRGEQPMIVDSGAATDRAGLLTALDAVVDPAEVRWLFLSHQDPDHAGNVEALLARCPAAVLATSWQTAQQLALAGLELPAGRVRWLADGDVLDAGDRAFVAQRPPLYDAGATLGLFDAATGVYWAADCFSCRLAAPGLRFAELDQRQWRESFVALHQWGSPWLDSLELRRWERSVEQLARADLDVIASAHGPTIGRQDVARALALLRELPELAIVQPPVG